MDGTNLAWEETPAEALVEDLAAPVAAVSAASPAVSLAAPLAPLPAAPPDLAVVAGAVPDVEPLAHGMRAVRELLEATECVLFWVLPQGLAFRAAQGSESARLARDLDAVAESLDSRIQGPAMLVPVGRMQGGADGLVLGDSPLAEAIVLGERLHRKLALGLATAPCRGAVTSSQMRFAHAVFRDMVRLVRSREADTMPVARRNGRWQKHQFAGLVGASRPMRRLFSAIEKLAVCDVNVLVLGESGTGKELVARAIHEHGTLAGRRFVAQNCAALPEALLESELFGHCRGAFTGANLDKRGLFEEAHGGTFFLDEIADMPVPLQIKMLRVLQEGEIRRLGETRSRRVQVRIIAATNKRLHDEVAAKRFRSDLYYRLNVVKLELAPLRRRREDITLLARYFCDKITQRAGRPPLEFADEVLQRFVDYDWPGNVRELENEIERLVALHGDDGIVRPWMLSEPLRYGAACDWSLERLEDMRDLNQASEFLERAMIARSLERHAWNKSRAAHELGVSRQGLIKKIQRLRLVRPVAAVAAAAASVGTAGDVAPDAANAVDDGDADDPVPHDALAAHDGTAAAEPAGARG